MVSNISQRDKQLTGKVSRTSSPGQRPSRDAGQSGRIVRQYHRDPRQTTWNYTPGIEFARVVDLARYSHDPEPPQATKPTA
jgi:hypothetical protein